MFRVLVFVFQVTVTRDGALLSWRWLNTCLPMVSSKLIPSFALLAGMALALVIKQSLSQPMSFLTFTLLILPHPTREERVSGCVVFSCQLGLNHKNYPSTFLYQALNETFPFF